MRCVAGLSVLLLLVGSVACRVEIAPRGDQGRWVRTLDGWEKPTYWAITPVYAPRLRPSLVALGQTLASMLALVAFQPLDSRRRSIRGPLMAGAGRIPCGLHAARAMGRREAARETA